MNLAPWLSAYLNLNLLLVLALASLGLFSLMVRRLGVQSGAVLSLHYSVLAVLLGLTLVHPLLPRSSLFEPAAKVWSAQSIASFLRDGSGPEKSGYLSVPIPGGDSALSAHQVARWMLVVGGALAALGGWLLVSDAIRLFRLRRQSHLVRQVGRVRVWVNAEIAVPFSYWLPNQAHVVIPWALLDRRRDYQIALRHELQHHRHGDTRWVYVMWILRWLCFFNPAMWLWNRWLGELQEFACDETLVDLKKVESQAYARCLIEVAESALQQQRDPVCATGLTFLVGGNLLQRRIQKMMTSSTTSPQRGRRLSLAAGLAIAALLGAAAYAGSGLVQDRRVTMAQARAMAARAENKSGIPIVVNDLVVQQLNRFVGTPDGREYMRSALARMENYRTLVGDTMQRYGVPPELLAVPLIESGYRNLSERPNSKVKAAGIWQFIPSTARVFGLRVDERKDERLDVPLLTDAAMRYLLSNYLRFKDWHLSLLSYNMGEAAVQNGIEATGARDAWTLIRSGFEGDKDYLPKVMAAILILRNPDSVQ